MPGASGNKPCFKCFNLTANKSEWARGSAVLVDLRESDMTKFVQITDVELWANVDALAAVKPQVNKKSFERHEKLLGLTHNEFSVLACRGLREFFSPTRHIWSDPGHVILANGVFSWSVWELIERLQERTRLSWSSLGSLFVDIDWRIPVSFGRTANRYQKNALFSVERIKASRESDGHTYKGGMGDLLMILRPLLFFCNARVHDSGRTPGVAAAIAAYKAMALIVECFFCPQVVRSWARARMPDLGPVLKQAFDLHFAAYPGDPKSKWHALLHLDGPLYKVGIVSLARSAPFRVGTNNRPNTITTQ